MKLDIGSPRLVDANFRRTFLKNLIVENFITGNLHRFGIRYILMRNKKTGLYCLDLKVDTVCR